MSDNANIDTRVSASLHPNNVMAIDGYDDETSPVLASTMQAFEAAYRGIASVHDVRIAAAKDPTLNDAAVVIATQETADRVFTRIAKTFDTTTDSLKRGIAFLEAELISPVESKAAQSVSAEIRAHFKGMNTGDRMTLLRRSINGGDHTTATAVLGAPAYLSGMTEGMRVVMLLEYHTRHEPQKAKRLKVMQGALHLFYTRSGLLFGEMEKAVGMPAHKVKALKERKLHADKRLKSA